MRGPRRPRLRTKGRGDPRARGDSRVRGALGQGGALRPLPRRRSPRRPRGRAGPRLRRRSDRAPRRSRARMPCGEQGVARRIGSVRAVRPRVRAILDVELWRHGVGPRPPGAGHPGSELASHRGTGGAPRATRPGRRGPCIAAHVPRRDGDRRGLEGRRRLRRAIPRGAGPRARDPEWGGPDPVLAGTSPHTAEVRRRVQHRLRGQPEALA